MKQIYSVLQYFPKELSEPRPQQIQAINFLDKVFKDGINIAVLEKPTGAGKSGVAMTVSRAFGGGIVACPTVQLQIQYLRDFNNTAPLIGRSRFPCLKRTETAADSIPIIVDGRIPKRPEQEFSCANGPCLKKPSTKRLRIKAECDTEGGCPHQHSLVVAQRSETIISNWHSLMYCVSLNETIERRRVLVLDEAHDLEKFMRDFLKVKFKVRRIVQKSEIHNIVTTKDWLNWLQRPEQLALLKDQDMRDSYSERLERLEAMGEGVFETWPDPEDKQMWVELTPVNIGGACRALLFSLADKIVLMSGTIYSKEQFLWPLGIDPNSAAFLRIPSDFPKENRLVYRPRIQGLDLSHKHWERNFPHAVSEIKRIVEKHKDQKGIIHTSSYRMNKEITEALQGFNIITHTSENFADRLKQFMESEPPSIFVSPICSQGVDFKNDLARWQIIVRPQYAAISDPYIKFMLDKNNWGYYNYKAAIVFGQQLGRPVRSKDDWGVTYLLSSTFNNLINKTNYLLPTWLKEGFS